MAQRTRLLVTLFAAFAVTGVDCTMLGPALPSLSAAWGLADLRSGGLLFVQPVAGVIAAAICTRNLSRSITGGAWMLAVGLLLFGCGRYSVAHLALAITGFGFGLLLTAGNILCGKLAQDQTERAKLLALLNFAWGVGSISSGLLFAAFRRAGHPFAFFWTLAAVMTMVAVLCSWSLRGERGSEESGDPLQAGLSVAARALFAAAFFLYSGMEDAISGWLPTYVERLLHSAAIADAAKLGAYSVTAFFLAEMLGRLTMPWTLRLVRPARLYVAALVVLLCALAAIILALPSAAAASSALALAATAGLGVAPVYPLLLARLIGRARSEHGLGWVFSCGGIGGGTLPWLGGAVSVAAGAGLAVRWAFAVPAAAAVLLLLLGPALQRDSRQPYVPNAG